MFPNEKFLRGDHEISFHMVELWESSRTLKLYWQKAMLDPGKFLQFIQQIRFLTVNVWYSLVFGKQTYTGKITEYVLLTNRPTVEDRVWLLQIIINMVSATNRNSSTNFKLFAMNTADW
jgi:hypothetical protein